MDTSFPKEKTGQERLKSGLENRLKSAFFGGIREYLDRKLPQTSPVEESLKTMERWQELLSDRGLKWKEKTLDYVANSTEVAEALAKAIDVPLGKIPILPDNTAVRLMSTMAKRGPLLDPIDKFLFKHFPVLGTEKTT